MNWLQDPVVLGLIMDIIGAGVIALPDVPKASKILRAGRLQFGKNRLESKIPLLEKMVGHDEIVEEVEEFYRRINDDPEFEVEGLDKSTHLTLHDGKIVNPSTYHESGKQIGEYPYGVIEPVIDQKIRKQETRVRSAGFLLLAVGFSLQLLGQIF